MALTSLVSLDEAYAWMNITNPPAGYDAKLQSVIDAAAAYVQFQTGPIIPQTFTENRDGGGPYIYLDNTPILSVTSVTEWVGQSSYSLTASTVGSGGNYGYQVLDANMGKIARLYSGFVGSFVGGQQNITVVYTAGLTAVPDDVRMAVLEDIRGLFTQTQYGGQLAGISESQDGWTASDFNPIGSFPRLAALLQGPSRNPSIA